MELAKIIEFNRKFKELRDLIEDEANNSAPENRSLSLALSYMDDAGNKLNQCVGEATMAGHLTNPE
tara:strand:+ start:30 stop:227 length:198 start_codon:yes stop_codon:yes gene_type:complete